MNLLTKIKLKKEINSLTKAKKPYKLYKLVYNGLNDPDEVIALLNKEQIELLTTGAMNRLDNDALIDIAISNKYANIDKIIKYLIVKFDKNYYDYEYHLSSFIGEHFGDFLNGALQKKNSDLIFYLANHASSNPEKFAKEIKRIIKYYLTYPVNKDTIYVAKLNGFNVDALENKIINGSTYLFVEYLNQSSNKEELITKFIRSKPSLLNFKYFLHTYQDTYLFSTITKIVANTNIDNDNLKGNYLIALYIFKPELREELLPIILELKDLNIIKTYLNFYSEDEQNEICTKYITTNKPYILFNLAISTKCTSTYKLIDLIILNHHHLIISLLTKLDNRFLDYTLDKLLKEKGSNYYLNLIYTLMNENDKAYMSLINFIFTYKHEDLFTPESLKKLGSKEKKQEKNNLTR